MFSLIVQETSNATLRTTLSRIQQNKPDFARYIEIGPCSKSFARRTITPEALFAAPEMVGCNRIN
jgi:hypothetical protein